MGSAARTHVGEWKIGGETGLVQTFSIANGLSVSLGLALPLVNRLSLGAWPAREPPWAPAEGGPGLGVDLPGATPASCPLLAAPS